MKLYAALPPLTCSRMHSILWAHRIKRQSMYLCILIHRFICCLCGESSEDMGHSPHNQDVINEKALNTRIKMLKKLIAKEDSEISVLERELFILQLQRALADEEWCELCFATLRERIDCLVTLTSSLKDPGVHLQSNRGPAEIIDVIIRDLLSNNFIPKAEQQPTRASVRSHSLSEACVSMEEALGKYNSEDHKPERKRDFSSQDTDARQTPLANPLVDMRKFALADLFPDLCSAIDELETKHSREVRRSSNPKLRFFHSRALEKHVRPLSSVPEQKEDVVEKQKSLNNTLEHLSSIAEQLAPELLKEERESMNRRLGVLHTRTQRKYFRPLSSNPEKEADVAEMNMNPSSNAEELATEHFKEVEKSSNLKLGVTHTRPLSSDPQKKAVVVETNKPLNTAFEDLISIAEKLAPEHLKEESESPNHRLMVRHRRNPRKHVRPLSSNPERKADVVEKNMDPSSNAEKLATEHFKEEEKSSNLKSEVSHTRPLSSDPEKIADVVETNKNDDSIIRDTTEDSEKDPKKTDSEG